MATEYRIVCVETLYPHRHITHVGTGSDPDRASERWDVMNVRTALRHGDRFYTQDPMTGRTADVEPYDAYTGAGVVYTIRSTADAIPGNNLDNLRGCRTFGS
jgi:hypothetical protein